MLRVKELQPALDTIVPYFHDYPARKMRVVGITGTNGKTTTSYITRASCARLATRSASLAQSRS